MIGAMQLHDGACSAMAAFPGDAAKFLTNGLGYSVEALALAVFLGTIAFWRWRMLEKIMQSKLNPAAKQAAETLKGDIHPLPGRQENGTRE